jgi:chromosome partitioning protein
MDRQNTATLWGFQASDEHPFPATVLSMAPLKEGFLDKMSGIIQKHDLIFIDCPPALDSLVPWAALLACDLALIPVIPVMDNVWASKQAEELVFLARDARKKRGEKGDGPKAAYLVNMLRRGKVFESCLETLRNKAKLPILKNSISMRNVFPESQLYGCVVKAFGKSEGANEIDRLADEISDLLGLNAIGRKAA